MSGERPRRRRNNYLREMAEKLGVVPRTIERQIQTAENLTSEAKELVKDAKISKKSALQLSRLAPNEQKEAASMLVAKEIKSVDEYKATKAPPVPKSTSDVSEPENEPMEEHPSLPVNAWKMEHAKLTAEQKTLNQKYLTLKGEVKEAEQIRRSVYDIVRREQREQQPLRAQDMEL